MKRILQVGALMIAVAMPAYAGEVEAAAEEAAGEWLAYVDEGEYVSSWNGAAEAFRKQIGPQDWQDAVSRAREPLGKLVSRKLRSAAFTTSLPGVPDGEYVVLHYDSVFENKAAAIETVTTALENGAWRVSGYFIK